MAEGFKIADAFVEIHADTKGVAGDIDKGLSGADGSVSAKGKGMGGKLMAGIGIGIAGAAALVAGPIMDSINAASDMAESQSKVNTVFGESAGVINTMASNAVTAYGLSKSAVLDFAGGLGNMYTQLGISTDAAADMSGSTLTLAADLGSFHNASTPEVLEAYTAAMRGEYDTMQKFIPTINAASVEQKALAMTGKESAAQLTDQDKALAAHTLMVEGAGAATGDFARTGDSLANQQKMLGAEVANLGTTFGTALLPAMTGLVGFVRDTLMPAFTGMMDFFAANPVVLQIVGAAIAVLTIAFIGLTVATWAMNTALLANPITWIILGVVALIAAIVLLIMNWDAVVAFVTDIWGQFIAWFTGVMDGFITWWNQLWTTVWTWITDVWNNIVSFVTTVVTAVVDFIVAAFTAYVEFWIGVWTAIITFVIDTWNNIVSFVTGVVNAVVNFIVSAFTAYVSFWVNIWTQVFSFLSGIWNSIVSFVSGAINNVVSFIVNGVTGMYNTWSGIWRNVGTIVSQIVGNVQGFIGNMLSDIGAIPGKIMGALSGAASWLVGVGRDIINGLINGVKQVAGNIANAVLGPIKAAVDGVKGFLGIKSPSRLFRNEIGAMIPAGVEAGVEDGAGDMNRTLAHMVQVPELPRIEPRGVGDVAGTGARYGAGQPQGDTINWSGNIIIDASTVDDFNRIVRIFENLPQAARQGRMAIAGA